MKIRTRIRIVFAKIKYALEWRVAFLRHELRLLFTPRDIKDKAYKREAEKKAKVIRLELKEKAIKNNKRRTIYVR